MCLKGKMYPVDISMLLYGIVVGKFTSRVFSGGGSGIEEWGTLVSISGAGLSALRDASSSASTEGTDTNGPSDFSLIGTSSSRVFAQSSSVQFGFSP